MLGMVAKGGRLGAASMQEEHLVRMEGSILE